MKREACGTDRQLQGEKMDFLRGIKVVSFNHFLLGPVGMQYLADLGADVIAVEPVDGAFQRKWGGVNSKTIDGQTMLFLLGNRNKRSLSIDLKSAEGLEIAKRLTRTADVVCENFRPGVMDKLGLGYRQIAEHNPSVVFAAASGFGADGPYADKPGQDLVIQAMSGLAAITGTVETGPRAVGVSAVDHHGAALLAMGVLAALLRRATTGKGCRVDVDLLSAAINLQNESFTCFLNGPRPASVTPHNLSGGWYFAAPYGIFPTSDGHLAISLTSLATLAEALEAPQIAAFTSAEEYDRRDEINALVAEALKLRSNKVWEGVLTRHKIWHSPVNDYATVVQDPQVVHNKTFMTVPGATGAPITLVGHPIKYDGKSPEVRLPPQPMGAQTIEILEELGYSASEIAALETKGVVVRHAAPQGTANA
jgi:crotonobetainyl-CoA:carnitine CoA-transferase CaiB-like acyl-CoA transferase